MAERKYLISMSKEEMLRYYENKIVQDGIRECSEFNISVYLSDYGDDINLKKYKNEIMQLLYRDERIADVMIDEDYCIDMVFWTSYCPYYYDEIEDITPKEEIKILDDFNYYCHNKILNESYSSVREVINGFVDRIDINKQEQRDITYNILKKNIAESGFIDKYIENNSETFITLQNKNEFEKIIEDRINKLENQLENQEEEEFE